MRFLEPWKTLRAQLCSNPFPFLPNGLFPSSALGKSIVGKSHPVLGGRWVRHSSEELSTAIESSFVDVFATLCTASPGAILRNEGDAIIYSSGAPNSLLNGVLAARFDSRNMKKRTEEVLSFFEERHLPMTFFVGPCCCPPELDDHLRSLGLAAGWTRPGMAADLGIVRRMPYQSGSRSVPPRTLHRSICVLGSLQRGSHLMG